MNKLIKKDITARDITTMALLMAMQIVFTRFLSIETEFFRMGFGFIPTVIMSMALGPFYAGIGSGLSDFFGFVLYGKGSYFPGFTLSAILGGIIYGLLLYRKPVDFRRIILAKLLITIFVNLILNSTWLFIAYKIPFWELMPLRILRNVLSFPVEVSIIWLMLNRLPLKRLRIEES